MSNPEYWLDPPEDGFENWLHCSWCEQLVGNGDGHEIDYWTYVCDDCWEIHLKEVEPEEEDEG